MIPRERIQAAFRHREPDRVPIFEQSMSSRVLSPLVGRPLTIGVGELRWREALALLEGPDAHAEFTERVLEDYAAVVTAFDFDMVSYPWRGPAATERIDEHTFRTVSHVSGNWHVYRYVPEWDLLDDMGSSLDQDGLAAVEREVVGRERVEAGREGDLYDEPDAIVAQLVARFGADRAVAAGPGIAIPAHPAWWQAMAEAPDLVDRYLDCQLASALRTIRTHVRQGVDVIWGGGDLAGTTGPFYSPAHFRRFLLPRLQKMTALCRELGVPYVFRSDGWLWPIAEELFVRSGVDGYGEIDYQAGMRLGELKARFPHLTLWGNVDCAGVLVRGRPSEVREQARECIEQGAPGGGYVFGSSNAIHAGVPPANFAAMIEAAREFGRYR